MSSSVFNHARFKFNVGEKYFIDSGMYFLIILYQEAIWFFFFMIFVLTGGLRYCCSGLSVIKPIPISI